MTRYRTRIPTGTVLLAVLLLFLGFTLLPAIAGSFNIDETHSFDLTDVREINVSASSTSVHVIAAPAGSGVRFHLYGDAPKRVWLEYRQQGDALTVVEMREPALSFHPEHMSLDVYLPRDYASTLTVDTASGALTLDALTLQTLQLYTSSGEIAAKPLTVDTLTVNSTSGGIVAEALTARTLHVEATSGSIDIQSLTAREATVTATSADVRLRYAAFDGDALHIRNTSGGIRLALPADAGFTFDICRTSSDIRSDFAEIKATDSQPDTLHGQVNSGAGMVCIDCTSGDIDIGKV